MGLFREGITVRLCGPRRGTSGRHCQLEAALCSDFLKWWGRECCRGLDRDASPNRSRVMRNDLAAVTCWLAAFFFPFWNAIGVPDGRICMASSSRASTNFAQLLGDYISPDLGKTWLVLLAFYRAIRKRILLDRSKSILEVLNWSLGPPTWMSWCFTLSADQNKA